MWKWKNEFELLKQQARRNGCDYANLIQTGKLGPRDNDDHNSKPSLSLWKYDMYWWEIYDLPVYFSWMNVGRRIDEKYSDTATYCLVIQISCKVTNW